MRFFQKKFTGPEVRPHLRPRLRQRKVAVCHRDLLQIWNHCSRRWAAAGRVHSSVRDIFRVEFSFHGRQPQSARKTPLSRGLPQVLHLQPRQALAYALQDARQDLPAVSTRATGKKEGECKSRHEYNKRHAVHNGYPIFPRLLLWSYRNPTTNSSHAHQVRSFHKFSHPNQAEELRLDMWQCHYLSE